MLEGMKANESRGAYILCQKSISNAMQLIIATSAIYLVNGNFSYSVFISFKWLFSGVI